MTGSVGAEPFERVVALPLGRVRVRLDRRGLGLGDRGGFEASWAEDETGEDLDPEGFRQRVKEHLAAVCLVEQGREAPKVTLNLASHQLVEDVIGWTRLNAGVR